MFLVKRLAMEQVPVPAGQPRERMVTAAVDLGQDKADPALVHLEISFRLHTHEAMQHYWSMTADELSDWIRQMIHERTQERTATAAR